MDLATIVQFIFPLLTCIAIGIGILLLSMTTTLRQSNQDLRERVRDVETENARHETTIKAQATKIEAQSAEIALWSKTVTGEVHLVAITDLLTHHHERATKVWEAWGVKLDHVDALLTRIVEIEEGRRGPS
jgi:hypothetical protein